MKTIIYFIITLFLFACSNQVTEEKGVKFTANKFGVESGNLKSFDINEWKHFHYPHQINVVLKNINTEVEYIAIANNGTSFFNNGTDVVYLPVGNYRCSVVGGGYPNDSLTHSYSYYVWGIKDTTIIVTPNTNTIKFNLDKTSALVVKDATSDIKLIAYRNASLFWTGRDNYDFAYVTPGVYSGLYTDSLGNQLSTEWFDINEDNYYYFVTPTSVKSNVIVPEFEKNEINF